MYPIFQTIGRTRPGTFTPAPRDAFLPAEMRQVCPINVNFNGHWQLSGLRLRQDQRFIVLTLRWRCLQKTFGWLRCFAHVLDPEGGLIASMDHDLLDGSPPLAEWDVDDEGYEIRYLDLTAVSDQFDATCTHAVKIRLGLFDPLTNLRLPVAASTLAVTDDFTAAVATVDEAPGREHQFQFDLVAVTHSCRVVFDGGIVLV